MGISSWPWCIWAFGGRNWLASGWPMWTWFRDRVLIVERATEVGRMDLDAPKPGDGTQVAIPEFLPPVLTARI